ncbi:MAG: hypothetical protein AAGJ18_08630 [Bacteroidota bacterium]
MKPLLIKVMLLLFVNVHSTVWAQLAPSVSNHGRTEVFRSTIQFHLVRAENLFRQGNHLDALLELDNAVELAPQSAEVYLHRALLKFRLGMANEAQQDAAKAARLNPLAPTLFGLKGRKSQMDLLAFYPEELYRKVSFDQRIAYYEDILDTWYEGLGANKNETTSELAANQLAATLTALQEREWETALEVLAKLKSIDKNASLMYDLEGLIYLELEDLEQAGVAFRQSLELDPNNAAAWFNYSKISQAVADWATSLDYLNRAIRLNPTMSKAYFERALVKKQLGDLTGAIADYTKVINREGPNFIAAYFNRAICFKKIGKLTAALSDLSYVLEIEPDHALTWKVRGNLFLLLGRYNQTVDDFTRAIDLNTELGAAYFNRAVAHLLNLNPIAACVDFERSSEEGYERGDGKQVYFCGN